MSRSCSACIDARELDDMVGSSSPQGRELISRDLGDPGLGKAGSNRTDEPTRREMDREIEARLTRQLWEFGFATSLSM